MRTFAPVPCQISDNRTLDADLRLKQLAYHGDNKVGARISSCPMDRNLRQLIYVGMARPLGCLASVIPFRRERRWAVAMTLLPQAQRP